jgi:hypothetical protein
MAPGIEVAKGAGRRVQSVRFGIFKKLLENFGDWLDWVCEHSTNLVRTSSFGLKRKLGCMGLGQVYKRVFPAFRGVCLRAGSRRMGFMPNIKKAKKMGFAPVYGSDTFSVGLGSEHSAQGVSSSSADIEGSSPAPKALGFSVATIPTFLEHSSSIPLEVSAS